MGGKSLLIPYINKNFARYKLFLQNGVDVAPFPAGVNFLKEKIEARLVSFIGNLHFLSVCF